MRVTRFAQKWTRYVLDKRSTFITNVIFYNLSNNTYIKI